MCCSDCAGGCACAWVQNQILVCETDPDCDTEAVVPLLSGACFLCLVSQPHEHDQPPSIEPCLLARTTCADTNADGTADDPYDCSADVNYIDASPADITCANVFCNATECCTVIPWDRSGTEIISLYSTIVVQGDLADIGSSNMREEFELAFGALALQYTPPFNGSIQ